MPLFDRVFTRSISYLLLNIHYINSHIVLLIDLYRKMVSRTNPDFDITHPDCHSCWCSSMAPLDVEQIKQGNIPLIIRQGKKLTSKIYFLWSRKSRKTWNRFTKDIADTVKSSKATESMPSHVHFWSQTSASTLVSYLFSYRLFWHNQSKHQTDSWTDTKTLDMFFRLTDLRLSHIWSDIL